MSAGGDSAEIQQDDNGQIFVSGSNCGGVLLVQNATAINVTGGTGDQFVRIDLYDTTGVTTDWGTINWAVSLGTSSGDDDFLDIENFSGDDAINVTLGASGIDLNTDADLDVTYSGVEEAEVEGCSVAGNTDCTGATAMADTISAGGDTTTGAAFALPLGAWGYDGDDTIIGGTANDNLNGGLDYNDLAGGLGDDSLNCDTSGAVDYSGSATAVTVDLAAGTSTGEGLDTITGCEDIVGSALGDTLTGDAADNYITPGAGDDKVDGAADTLAAGDFVYPADIATADVGDVVDFSGSAAAVVVDVDAGTATGDGTDTLSHVESVQGSDFDDTLTGDSGHNALMGGKGNDALGGAGGDDILAGEAGTDWVDYGWSADAVDLTLTCGATLGEGVIGGSTNPTDDTVLTTENAVLTSDDDTFKGNDFGNTVEPNGGQNALQGDCVTTSNPGGDTLDYSVGYDTGVSVNMAGGSTAGDSATGFESVIGTAFADNIVGSDSSNTIKSRKGSDNVRAGGGDDTVKAGAGNDLVRAGTGDDDLWGQKGNDNLNGGKGSDFCKGGPGKDKLKSCESGHK
jgi:hypothetical protein